MANDKHADRGVRVQVVGCAPIGLEEETVGCQITHVAAISSINRTRGTIGNVGTNDGIADDRQLIFLVQTRVRGTIVVGRPIRAGFVQRVPNHAMRLLAPSATFAVLWFFVRPTWRTVSPTHLHLFVFRQEITARIQNAIFRDTIVHRGFPFLARFVDFVVVGETAAGLDDTWTTLSRYEPTFYAIFRLLPGIHDRTVLGS